ncbi:uncharacterized protein STEHIDRAFT_155127 [Stereum hirsutum FP-91666 SS1]|uniref:uncharacterized protein n=1 Tax=Stereum hirsutum (strain FP-91666) TaxID=721885 RepID=UPI000440C5DC|nr:uncharacterized protein STEHIDRAFT_155127 [Stereum hirsutum FP-91666 SS1]EIM87753.1 hypothetical protein STEHIDRAFT_155127 [Stereum hirsutum FP-91666 SS1]
MVSSPSPTPQSLAPSSGPDPSLPTRSLHRVLSAGCLGNRVDGEAVIERDGAKGYRVFPENLSGIEAASGASPSINDDNTPTIHTSPSDSRLHSLVLGSDRTKDRERLSSTTPRTIYSSGIFSSTSQYRNSALTVHPDAPFTMGPPPPTPPRRVRLPSRPMFHSHEPGSSRYNEAKKGAFDDEDDEASLSYPRSSFVGGGMRGSSPPPRAYRRTCEIQSAPQQPDPSIASAIVSSQGQEDIAICNYSARHRTSPTVDHPHTFQHFIPGTSSGSQRSSKKRPRSSPSGQDKNTSERVPPLRGWHDEAKPTDKRISSKVSRSSDRSMPPPPLPMRFTNPSLASPAPPISDRPRTRAKPPRSSSLSNGTQAGVGKGRNSASSNHAKNDSRSSKETTKEDQSSAETELPLCKVHGTSFRIDENDLASMKSLEALRKKEEEFFEWHRGLAERIRESMIQDSTPPTFDSSERDADSSTGYTFATFSATGTSAFSAGSMASNSNNIDESSMEYLNPDYIDDTASMTQTWSDGTLFY